MAMTDITDNGAGDVTSVVAPAQSDATHEPADVEHSPTMDEVRGLREEAKRHRLARRAAEQERDTLRGRVDAHDKTDVERQLADRFAAPGDIWHVVQLSDLRDPDTGELDDERIGEHATHVLEQHPHWAKSSGMPSGFSSGVRQPIKRSATIGEAFKRSLHGR
jgi:hypothetical protein